MPGSSSGCSRCCTYGSAGQQAKMARVLAEIIDAGMAKIRAGIMGKEPPRDA